MADTVSDNIATLKIAEIIRENDETVSLRLEIPEKLRADFSFHPGQFIAVTAKIDGKYISRNYSISDHWGDYSHPAMLQITIKKQPHGIFSNFAHQLKSGDKLQATPPQGRFAYLPSEEFYHYAAIAGGSGITPIISVIQAILEQTHPNSTITLIYGSRYKASLIFRERIETLKNRYMNRFNPLFITSREQQDVPLFSGRISHEKFDLFFETLIPQNRIQKLFICAPHQMAKIATESALASGYDKAQIMRERFGNEQEAASGQSQTDQAQKKDEAKSLITLTAGGHSTQFVIHKSEGTILDAGLRAGLPLPHSCKAGVCTSCLALLEQGEVEMHNQDGLASEDAAKGYILCCQAIPKSQKIHVNFDK